MYLEYRAKCYNASRFASVGYNANGGPKCLKHSAASKEIPHQTCTHWPTTATATAIAPTRVPAIAVLRLICRRYSFDFAIPIGVGDEFVDFKDTMADWSIAGEHKVTFRHQKSDKTRNIVLCAHADCSVSMQP